MKASAATIRPRTKPPSEKASSSSSGEAGEESWSWIAPWNFCCRIEEELLVKALIDQVIMIRPGITKTTYSIPCRSPDPRAEGGAEDGDVEEGFQQRRAERLFLDLHEAADLAPPEREEADLGGAHGITSASTWERESSLRPTRAR